MNAELFYLTWVTILTGILWIPYILYRFARWGIADTVGYPSNAKPQSPWAARMMKAHANAVENLVIFAALVLVAHAAGISNALVVCACAVFFWARLVHAVAYTFSVPWVRTGAFVVRSEEHTSELQSLMRISYAVLCLKK